MYTPTLLYTTEEHGCSLTTFYVRVEQHEPTLLMIKTLNNEVSEIKNHNHFSIKLFVFFFIELNCFLRCFLRRYLVHIVRLVGTNEIWKMTMGIGKRTLVRAKPFCSRCIRIVQNIHGSALTVIKTWATALNYSWQLTHRW